MNDKNTNIEKKRTINRSPTIITTNNENNIEKIDLADYDLKEKIGKNAYGYTQICKNIKTNKTFAMKVLKKCDLLQSKIVEHITSEFKVLSSIYHPFIIELKGINCTDPCALYFLLEYVPGGDLNSLIKTKTNKRLPIEHAKFYLACLVTALDYLHKKNIIYRDLKPENIVININGYIKLTEFGYTKIMKSDMTYSLCGTPEYCSPEMIDKTGHNKCVDYWGLGILLYEMLTGLTPFTDSDPMKIYQKIKKGKIAFPKTMNKNAKTIIKHFLNTDINKRLGCTKKGIVEIIEHPFFDNFDWKGLLYRQLEAPFIPSVNGPMDTSNYNKKFENNYFDDDAAPISQEKDPFYNWLNN